MADWQKTACCSRWGCFQLEISFEWGTTRISIRTFIILNIYINDLDDSITRKALKCEDVTKLFRKVCNDGDKQKRSRQISFMV